MATGDKAATDTLEKLALHRAVLVQELYDALIGVMDRVRALAIETFTEWGTSVDSASFTTRHSGTHQRPTLVQLTLCSTPPDTDKKRREASVTLSWRPTPEGCVIEIATTLNTGQWVSSLRGSTVRARALELCKERGVEVPFTQASRGQDHQEMWRSEPVLEDPEDLEPIQRTLEGHLKALPSVTQAFAEEAARLLSSKKKETTSP